MKYVLFYYIYAHLYVERKIYNSIHENLKALEGPSLLKGTLCPEKKRIVYDSYSNVSIQGLYLQENTVIPT